MARKTRPWRSEDTRNVLIRAAWVSLHESQRRGTPGLDVADALERANQLWAEEFPDLPRPAFTRGAIVANFQTVEQLYAAALRYAFGAEQTSVPKLFNDLAHDLDVARKGRTLTKRRLDATAALRDYVVQDLIRASTDVASLRLYLDMLSRAEEPALAAVAQETYDSFQAHMTRSLAYFARITELRFDIEECARLTTALIEGAAMRIAFDRGVTHSFATQVGTTASLLPGQLAAQPQSV